MKIIVSPASESLKTVDALVVTSFQGEKKLLESCRVLDSLTRRRAQKFLDTKKFNGKKGEFLFCPIPFAKAAGAIFFIGLGESKSFTLEKIRQAAYLAFVKAKEFQFETLRFDLDSIHDSSFTLHDLSSAVAESLFLSLYRFNKYKSKSKSTDENSPKIKETDLVTIHEKEIPGMVKAINEAEIVADAVSFVRDLANEPANVMTPRELGYRAKQMAVLNNLKCQVLGKPEIVKLKMGGLLAVSRGSKQPPQFIILENRVANPVDSKPIVLVGKGITFDTGGISIKPSKDMDRMKFDMCGAAAVIGTMKAVARLKLPVRVVGLVPTCENMPSEDPTRPGDIITMMNAKTVEVNNTDAEGRLILADALSYAEKYKPRSLLDIATLTGAVAYALSDKAMGILGTDPDLIRKVKEAGESTGERCWEFPLWEEYAEMIRGDYADIENTSKGYGGGTITAAMFLKEFAEHTSSWVHLDIAGVAWADKPKPYTPIGATGAGVRLFVEFLRRLCHKK